jgi:hypothetical protein
MSRRLARYGLAAVFLVILGGALLASRRDGDAAAIVHEVPNVVQETPNWCWAAVTQQVLLYTTGRKPPRQCVIAAAGLGRNVGRCCDDYTACDATLNMQGVQELLNRMGGGPAWGEALLDAEAVYEELRRGRIIIAGLWDTDVDGHVVVIRGLEWEPWLLSPLLGDRAILRVNDPSGFFADMVPYSRLAKYWRASMIVGE